MPTSCNYYYLLYIVIVVTTTTTPAAAASAISKLKMKIEREKIKIETQQKSKKKHKIIKAQHKSQLSDKYEVDKYFFFYVFIVIISHLYTKSTICMNMNNI